MQVGLVGMWRAGAGLGCIGQLELRLGEWTFRWRSLNQQTGQEAWISGQLSGEVERRGKVSR